MERGAWSVEHGEDKTEKIKLIKIFLIIGIDLDNSLPTPYSTLPAPCSTLL